MSQIPSSDTQLKTIISNDNNLYHLPSITDIQLETMLSNDSITGRNTLQIFNNYNFSTNNKLFKNHSVDPLKFLEEQESKELIDKRKKKIIENMQRYQHFLKTTRWLGKKLPIEHEQFCVLPPNEETKCLLRPMKEYPRMRMLQDDIIRTKNSYLTRKIEEQYRINAEIEEQKQEARKIEEMIIKQMKYQKQNYNGPIASVPLMVHPSSSHKGITKIVEPTKRVFHTDL